MTTTTELPLKWHETDASVWAISCCHDNGDHFGYRFELRWHDQRWMNRSDHELGLDSDRPATFLTIAEAQTWAERMERGWLAEAAMS